MTREDIIRIYNQVSDEFCGGQAWAWRGVEDPLQRFAALVAAAERKAEREAILAVIEAYKVPVGNSAAGEMACEWTMDALRDLRDAIRARGSDGTST